MNCTSCKNSIGEDETAIVLSRRIVVRSNDGLVEVKFATSVAQICPVCSEKARSETIEFGCILPPLLDLEKETAMNYLSRMVDGSELTEINKLPPACTLCRTELPCGVRYLDLSIASERYVWQSTPPGPRSILDPRPSFSDRRTTINRWQVIQSANFVNVANICGPCSKETWNIDVRSGNQKSMGFQYFD